MPKELQPAFDQLLVPAERGVPAIQTRGPSQQDAESIPTSVPLAHYLWILRRHAWKMATFVAISMLMTFLVSVQIKPIYESAATIDIDMQAPSDIVGQDSNRTTSSNDTDQFIATQIALIQSDAVLRPVAKQFNLRNVYDSKRPPSAETIRRQANAPVTLGGLLVSRPPNTLLILIKYRSQDPQLAADIANATATSYLSQSYNIQIRSSVALSTFMEKQLDELKANMEKSSRALAEFERALDVINPDERTSILTSRLQELNTEYTAAQADRVTKEADWKAAQSGTLEAAQTSPQGVSIEALVQALNEAQQRFDEVKTIYRANHPEYRQAAAHVAEVQRQIEAARRNVNARVSVEYLKSLNREKMLLAELNATKAEWDKLNAQSFQYQQLKQEADADRNLYEQLITKIREANINSGFQSNHVRIADVARPAINPVYPNTRKNILLAFLWSGILSLGAAFLLDSLDTTLRSPEEASRYLGTEVIGMLPLERTGTITFGSPETDEQRNRSTLPALRDNGKRASSNNGYYRRISGFEEAIRTIRNTILLGDSEDRIQSILVTSAVPGEGKSTLAAYLAIANAARGKNTLLVDGDLRRPSLHSKFGLPLREGLSNILNGELAWRDTVIPIKGRSNLSLIPSGPGSHRAADLIGPRLSDLLDDFAKVYDLVIMDSPPLLGFAECLQMARAADGVLIVANAGETRRGSVAAVVRSLLRLKVNLLGVVLNRVNQHTSAEGYSYYGYNRYGYYQGAKD